MKVVTDNWSFNMAKGEARVLDDFYQVWNDYCTTQHNCIACCMHDICGGTPILDRFSKLIQYHISIKED